MATRSPVAARVHEVALPPGETVSIDWDPRLLRHGVDVADVEVDQGVGPGVALVLREVQPNVSPNYRYEPRKARLELVIPLLPEAESPVPLDSPGGVVDPENR